MNMPVKVKIIRISIYYLMYKHLYNMVLNLDEAFLLSVSIFYKLKTNRFKVFLLRTVQQDHH